MCFYSNQHPQTIKYSFINLYLKCHSLKYIWHSPFFQVQTTSTVHMEIHPRALQDHMTKMMSGSLSNNFSHDCLMPHQIESELVPIEIRTLGVIVGRPSTQNLSLSSLLLHSILILPQHFNIANFHAEIQHLFV